MLLCFRFAGLTSQAREKSIQSGHREKATVERRQAKATEPKVKESPLTGDANYWGLAANEFGLPLSGLKPTDVLDTFDQARGGGGRKHEAVDIMAPRGTPVHAMIAGPVKKLFDSKQGGLTVYQFDMDEAFCYYYAHLDRYAGGVTEGLLLKQGEILGYVGSTGNASPEAPHLHLAVFRLGPEKNWWEGTPVNPYLLLQNMLRRP